MNHIPKLRQNALVASVAVFLLTVLGPRARAQVSYFVADPAFWPQSEQSYAVVVGDVDLDGNLDVVFGNENEQNTLFKGPGLFAPEPAWASGPTFRTRSLALGDVDGDGDLDLVCGNFSAPNHLYINTGGSFETVPTWLSESSDFTNSVILADVDGDGDLDLVCGNGAPLVPQTSVAYRNVGGPEVFETTPFWISQDEANTESIAVGDVDGDGRLDLVCGNMGPTGTANTRYLGAAGGFFETTPAWRSTETNMTAAVALGDMDGDGDLDLVCGNGSEYQNQPNTLYENIGGELDTIPGWRSDGSLRKTTSVALGDVDGDGDLDVVFGNFSNENQLYVNTAGVLAEGWISTGHLSRTQSLVLADVDGDGGLDQVAALTGSDQLIFKNTVYGNVTPVFGNTFDWQSNRAISSDRVELTDVNGDGYTDAIVHSTGVVELFANNDGTLDGDPMWGLPGAFSPELADFDGNGRPDLAVERSQPTRVQLHTDSAGVFAQAPAWTYIPRDGGIRELLSGDVVGGPGIDLLATGWGTGSSHLLFLNSGGVFNDRVWWARDVLPGTGASGALGDVDGDGDLDVAFGNRACCDATPHSDEMFLNNGTNLVQSPVWVSLPAFTSDIEFADVNGDGRLDLIAVTEDGISCYLNDRTDVQLPDISRDWVIPSPSTGIELVDVDGDGDIDVVSHVGYWLNRNGGFEDAPDKMWPPAFNTLGDIDFADLDRDGDLDLFGARSGLQSNFAVLGRRLPPFKGDPLAPTSHLANNAAFVRQVAVTESAPNTLRVDFALFDVESDPVYVIADYQYAGVPTWFPLDLVGYGGRIGPLATSAAGTSHSFDWDISRISFDGRAVVLRLRSVEVPKKVSQIQCVGQYNYSLGRPLVPIRPQIGSPGLVTFPTVTVGDTVCGSIVLSNGGTAPLMVSAIELPTVDMRIDEPVPFELAIDSTETISVCWSPCDTLSDPGTIRVLCNDPLVPEFLLDVSTDVRALEVDTDLLSQTELLPLGEAATVLVSPAPDVRVESGFLYYRTVGEAAFKDSIQLTSFERGFVALIPGAAVKEEGLEYYVRVENSCAVTVDPPGAPDSVFRRSVEAPISITTTPVPTGETGFLEGRTIRTAVALPEGAGFVGGAIHYREGGRVDYSSSPLVDSDGETVGTIPDSLVGARGVEYWVEVQTLTRTLTDPRMNPSKNPHTIRVTVANLEESVSHPGLERRMASVPLDFGRDFTGTLEALLSDQSEFGPYRHYTPENPENWRCHWYDPAVSSYAELDNDDPRFVVRPGRSFWLVARGTNRIETSPITGTSTPTDGPFEITLEPGAWNPVGNPFLFTVAWDAIRVDTMTMAEAENVRVEGPVGWSEKGGLEYDVEVLEPFTGYWVKNLTDTAVVLRVPPREFVATPQPMVTSWDDDASDDWRLGIRASSVGAVDGYNYIGMHTGAVSERDRYDRSEAPMSPGRAVSLYFPHGEWREHPGPYTVDIRGEVEPVDERTLESVTDRDLWGHVWAFDVAKSLSDEAVGDDVILEFEGIEAVPTNTEVYLIDRDLGRAVDIRSDGAYTFVQGTRGVVEEEADARFALVVGSADFVGRDLPTVPQETALHQNYPNPFNPATVIRYDVAEAGEVRLEIYNVRGALVRTLVRTHREPGRYEAVWKGDNQADTPAASGVYLYRLRSGDRAFTRKLVLLK